MYGNKQAEEETFQAQMSIGDSADDRISFIIMWKCLFLHYIRNQ